MQGLTPGLHRQFIFTGLRLGLYEHVRDMIAGSHEEASVGGRIAAALCTSALGITVANPADVVKVWLPPAVLITSVHASESGSCLAALAFMHDACTPVV